MKKTRQYPPIEYLKEAIEYDTETGIVTWRPRPRSHFKTDGAFKTFHTRRSGKIAGINRSMSCGKRHQVIVSLGNRHLAVHRLAWLFAHGYLPDLHVDHMNGDPWDNRLCNLRLATHAENLQNRGKNRNNTCGLKGVSWDKKRSLWQCGIGINGKRIALGRYRTKGEAAVAYAKAAIRYHGKFARF